MKLMLVRQFLETACIKLTDEELKAEMKNMEQLFQDSFGETGQAWLEEQRKFDVCDFDGMDKDRWQDALTKMSTMPLQQFTSPSDVKKNHASNVEIRRAEELKKGARAQRLLVTLWLLLAFAGYRFTRPLFSSLLHKSHNCRPCPF